MWAWLTKWFRRGQPVPANEWRFELKTGRHEIGTINERLERLALGEGVDESALRTLQIVLDELLTNALSYGKVDTQHPAQVIVSQRPGELRAVMRYHDIDFNPFTQAKRPDIDASIEARDIGGLGVHLVKEMVDDYGYQHADGLSTIAVAKRY
jgi:anti-sigma regulatory factor (Ser/Thr protein kinase)